MEVSVSNLTWLTSQAHIYLCSGNWDTRIAAGQAIEAIAKNVPKWSPEGSVKQGKIRSLIDRNP